MATKTINDAFAEAFDQIRSRRIFSSHPGILENKSEDNAEIKAAISKCIDFNVIVNRERKNIDEAFLLLAGLRGIVEDLIVLKFSLKFLPTIRLDYFEKLKELNLWESILAQKKFFVSNRPIQNIVGGGKSIQEIQQKIDTIKANLQNFWKNNGYSKNGPTKRDMSKEVGLSDTYDYIYFAASNFVHFNPHALLRTGWGPDGGPFTFSIENFGGYYRDLAAVYGAILYIGFAATFCGLFDESEIFWSEIAVIESILIRTPRWPELVTFEELNMPVPDQKNTSQQNNLLTIRNESGDGYLFLNILNEIKKSIEY